MRDLSPGVSIQGNSQAMHEILEQHPLLPVLTVESVEDGLAIAHALHGAGVELLEITLRTPCAYDAIAAIRSQVEGLVVGGGTVVTHDQLARLIDSGAHFGVSPGLELGLSSEAAARNFPYLPGISSVSELMLGLQNGYGCYKFFPAIAAGGVGFLKALQGPFPGVSFCPTGGIHAANFQEYYRLENTVAIGGSWVFVKSLIEQKKWSQLEIHLKDTFSSLSQV